MPQEREAIIAFEEAMAYGNLSLLGIAWAGLVTAEFNKQLPNNSEYPQHGRIDSNIN